MPCFFISAFITCVTSGTQPPQEVPAPVQLFSSPMVVTPPATAAHSVPLETSLHEQILCRIGSASTPSAGFAAPSDCGRIRNSGDSGNSILFSIICSRVPYSLASPTITHQQVFAAIGHHDLLVDLLALIGELVGAAAFDLAVRVADAGHVHTH